MIRLLVVSGSSGVLAGLQALLGAEEDLYVMGTTSPSEEPQGSGPAPDVVIADSVDTDEQALEELFETAPDSRVIFLGPPTGGDPLAEPLRGQVWGYLPRDSDGPQILAAVRAVAEGLVVVDRELAGELVALVRPAAVPNEAPTVEELTPRERQVLALVAEGLSNRSIAARLGLSEHTVKFHVASILGKLGAVSRTEAIRLGARRGLVVL